MRRSLAWADLFAAASSKDEQPCLYSYTDHLSVLQWQEQPACDRLLARLDQLPPDDVATSIVSFHEQVQGWLAYLHRARKPEQITLAYAKLEDICGQV